MTSINLKKIVYSSEDLTEAFEAISAAVDEGEANYRKADSNRVEEDLRIMRTVLGARVIVEDILEQLRPWANAFGFNPHDPEEVKLSWSLTVGKAVGICLGLLKELAPGWQSRGRIGTNNPNTVEALIESLTEINAAELDAKPTPRVDREEGESAMVANEMPEPKGLTDRKR